METLSRETLKRIEPHHQDAFYLSVSGLTFEVTQCLRVLPGRRIAARARLGEKTVFAKIFFGKQHQREAKYEKTTLEDLRQNRVRVPALVHYLRDRGLSVVLTQWLDDPDPWTDSQEEGALNALLTQLDGLYHAGYYQNDLHLDNFAWSNGRLWVLDSGAMKALPQDSWRKQRKCIANLGLLCAQFSIDRDPEVREQVIEFFGINAQRDLLHRKFRAARNNRIRKAKNKWLRSCTAIERTQCGQTITLVDRTLSHKYAEFEALTQSPETNGHCIKKGSRIHVYATHDWILKEYRDFSLGARLKRHVRMHPSMRSWVMGWTLNHMGAPTPKPVALVTHSESRSVLITPRVEGVRFSELLENDRPRADLRAHEIKSWISCMNKAGFHHGDLKAQNILITDTSIAFIDLDAAGWHRQSCASIRGSNKDIKRFKRNWDQFKSPA